MLKNCTDRLIQMSTSGNPDNLRYYRIPPVRCTQRAHIDYSSFPARVYINSNAIRSIASLYSAIRFKNVCIIRSCDVFVCV